MRLGYTLIETLLVIALAGIISVIAYFGINSNREGQKLANAEKELVSNLRSAQNKALSGSNTGREYTFLMDIPGKKYTISTLGSSVTYNWPEGITMTNPGAICFFNPNIGTNPTPRCNGTPAFNFGAEKVITITGIAGIRTVRVAGSGYFVTRIYAL